MYTIKMYFQRFNFHVLMIKYDDEKIRLSFNDIIDLAEARTEISYRIDSNIYKVVANEICF